MIHARGQSLVEFALGLGVLVLLALGTQLLARYHDIQRQAMLAARELAMTATWIAGRDASADPLAQLRARHLTHPGWRDPTGRAALLADDAAVQGDVQSIAAPGRTASLVDTAMRPLRVAGGFLGTGFDLTAAGYQRANLRIVLQPLQHLPRPFNSLQLQLTEQSAVLGDAWQASGPTQVRARAAGLVPTQMLAGQAAWLQPLLLPVSLIEPALRQFCPGLIEPELLPLDRLSGATPATPQPGERGCR
jgi:hypothetical protein